jgi:pimeloyl-ACP methyl ester carboxylesterase
MSYVDANGVKLHYLQIDNRKNRQGSDLVMIHGLATNLAFWYLNHAVPLSFKYRVTLYDLRGHGSSGITSKGYSPFDMSMDLRILLESLGIKNAHFIAHSFGGTIALNLASQKQSLFKSLILVDTHIAAVRKHWNANKWEYGKKIEPALKRMGLKIDLHNPYFGLQLLSYVAKLYENKIKISADLKKILNPAIGSFSRKTAIQWLHLLKSTQAEQEFMGEDGLTLDKLRTLEFPILAIYGENSQAMFTGNQLLDVWPKAEFIKMREAGHFFPITYAKEFRQTCLRFLEGSVTGKIVRRKGDDEKKCYFRSNRFHCRSDGTWFVNTRESSYGPFNSFPDAEAFFLSKLPFTAPGQGVRRKPEKSNRLFM